MVIKHNKFCINIYLYIYIYIIKILKEKPFLGTAFFAFKTLPQPVIFQWKASF